MTAIRKPFLAATMLWLVLSPNSADARSPATDAARADIQKTFGFVPDFLSAVPDTALPGAWMEMKSLQMNPGTALPGKIKELIGLAVAAQVPCKYCTYAHTEFAKLNGSSQVEIGEAVVMASLSRKWSTVLNGLQTDKAKFRGEIKQLVDNMKKSAAAKTPPPPPIQVVDSATALQDIMQSFGMVPDFLRRYPPEGLAGAWMEMRDVEMNPNTALSGKHKSLMGLAVSSQIPCDYCIVADTEFARLEGANDREISEAIAMASLVRHWSTILNGLQISEPQFRKDVDRIIKGAKKAAAKAPKSALNLRK